MKMELTEESINQIVVKTGIRDDLGSLHTLEQSIRRAGLLSPLIVNRQNVLISGRRRLQACRNIGMSRIAVFKIDIDPSDMLALDIQGDENLCRMQLNNREIEKLIALKKSLLKRGHSPLLKLRDAVRLFFARMFDRIFNRKNKTQ